MDTQTSGNMPRYLILGNLTIDNDRLEIRVTEQKIDVTLTELKIIKELLQQYPGLVQRKDLALLIWGNEDMVMPKTINTHLSNLRLKLVDWSFKIESIKNEGILLKMV